MCGIAGMIGPMASRDAVARMVSAMAHRGPDDEGTCRRGEVVLGACRLAILDLEGSMQPLEDTSSGLVLVFNGEVYNYRDVRAEAARLGKQSLSSGDAEAVLLAYAVWGEEYLEHLNGMFAFALFDSRRRVLRLVRDRFGEKPLYYMRDGREFVFASEVKPLLTSRFGARELEPLALHHYLSLRAVPSPLTMFRGVRRVRPGHEMLIDLSSESEPRSRRYYSPCRFQPGGAMSDEDWADGLRERMRAAVRARLDSDVPLGSLLSGGLDSTAVTAYMAEVEKPRTFFIGFDRGGRTEIDRRYARKAAAALGTEHQELEVTGGMLVQDLPRILWFLENPSVDGYQYYYAYELAKREVTVALSGQGGDEIFAGYGWFGMTLALERWRRRLGWLGAVPGTRALPAVFRMQGKHRGARRIDALLSGKGVGSSYGVVKHLFGDFEKQELYTKQFRERLSGSVETEQLIDGLLEEIRDWGDLEAVSWLQLTTDLPDILLRDTDTVSMAHSLEVRLPLLDHELVEYVLAIPSRLKMWKGEGKQVLKTSLRDIVPQEILDRPKLGFSFPMAGWLRGPLQGVAVEAFRPEVIERRGYFRPEAMRRYFDLFYKGRGSRSPFYVWCFLLIELFHRIFLDRSMDSPPDSLSELGFPL